MIMMMMIIVMNVCGLYEAVRTSICLAVRKLEQPHRPRESDKRQYLFIRFSGNDQMRGR